LRRRRAPTAASPSGATCSDRKCWRCERGRAAGRPSAVIKVWASVSINSSCHSSAPFQPSWPMSTAFVDGECGHWKHACMNHALVPLLGHLVCTGAALRVDALSGPCIDPLPEGINPASQGG
jgi:hypothetical protein